MAPSGGSEVKKEDNEVVEENHAEGETSCDDNVVGEQEDGDGGEAKVVEEAVARSRWWRRQRRWRRMRWWRR